MGKRLIVVCIGLAVAGLFASPVFYTDSRNSGVTYPENFRQWTRVRTMVIQEGHPLFPMFGGIHHIYANTQALEAMGTRKSFPNGAVFVMELLETRMEDHAITEADRKRIGVMEKNTRRFSDTGGWGFEAFEWAGGRRVVGGETGCFECHRTRESNDYVFGDQVSG